MFIVYGTRVFKKILGYTAAYNCSRCNNAAYFNVTRVRKWFSIFWIPIFPFSSKYYMDCPVCGNDSKFPGKEEALQLIVPQITPA